MHKILMILMLTFISQSAFAVFGQECLVNDGLRLLNYPKPPIEQIRFILAQCDSVKANDPQVLLLHGLLARRVANGDEQYKEAILWLEKAYRVAGPNNTTPALELALTYEWAGKPAQAEKIYQTLLAREPKLRPALLGQARVALAQKNWPLADKIYTRFLQSNKKDIEAILGLGRLALAKNNFPLALNLFKKVLLLSPKNKDAKLGLSQIDSARKDQMIIKANAVMSDTELIKASKTQLQLPIVNQMNSIPVILNKMAVNKGKIPNVLMKVPKPPKMMVVETQPKTKPLIIPVSCGMEEGFRLLQSAKVPISQIKTILHRCDKTDAMNVQTLLLHGLVAREEAKQTKDYQKAIDWLMRAKAIAAKDYIIPALELGVTYEWAKQFNDAKNIYTAILKKDPDSHAAHVGLARVLRFQNKLDAAEKIYNALIKVNANDIEAINGLGFIALAHKKYPAAKKYFNRVRLLAPNNGDALLGLKQVAAAQAAIQQVIAQQPIDCGANEALRLLNSRKPPYQKIVNIMLRCDCTNPDDVQVALLHGLLYRKLGMVNQNYSAAIFWLEHAVALSEHSNISPALELAVTYEWNSQPEVARRIYSALFYQKPNDRAILLGLARVARATYHLCEAKRIYYYLLCRDPADVESLVGLAWIKLANKDLSGARADFNSILAYHPKNEDARVGLALANSITRYLLTVDVGDYTVSGLRSYSGNINFFADINATDQLYLQYVHNTKEIALGLFFDPTLLPKNDILVGFQRQIPARYGIGTYYQNRTRTNLRTENRIGLNANVFVLPNLQFLIGGRNGYPSPWRNQLYYTNLTLFTSIPVNFGVTGFLGYEQLGGRTTAYSFDFSKEFPDRSFYDLGAAYSPTQHHWQIHGRFIFMVTRTQGLEGSYEHYYFNGTSILSVGWRIYW